MEPIKQEIINNIFENGDKLITGPILQTVLIDMIDDVNVKDQEILSKTGSWDEAVTQIPNLATKEEVTNLSESIARDLENVVDVDLTGYATEQWVQDQGYLTEHQDISNLATKGELNAAKDNLQGNITSLSESVARDLANVPEGVATEEWVQSQGYLKEHQDISGLATKTELTEAENNLQGNITSLSESVARDLANVDSAGYATETWVQNQGYLTEHQDISGLATKTEVTNLSESVARDIANVSVPEGVATEAWVQSQDYASKTYVNEAVSSSSVDLTGYATETWVENQGYLKEHQDISGLATKGELNSVSQSIQTDISNLATKGELNEAKNNLQGNITNLSESVARDLENVDLTGYATETWVQSQGYLKEHQDISGLATKTELNEAKDNLQGNITSLSESVARDLANVDVDLTGYATEAWVQSQDYASKSYVDNAVSSSSVDLTGYATETWVESQGYLKEHQDISNLATKSELNSVSESIQTDISNLATKSELTSVSESVQTDITNLSESVATSAVWKKGTGTDSMVQVLTGDDEAYTPTATGKRAIAVGFRTNASGYSSYAEGNYTNAEGNSSHAEGVYTEAKGVHSHTEGFNTIASNPYEHAQGAYNHSSTNQIFSVGAGESIKDPDTQVVTVTRRNAVSVLAVPNSETQILTSSLFVQNIGGYDGTNPTPGTNDLATVINGMSTGGGSSETLWKKGEGQDSIAQIIADGTNLPTATANRAIAVGYDTVASGYYSHAEGANTVASDKGSHAEGDNSRTEGMYSHAEGGYTITSNLYEHAQGKWNHTSANQIFSVGAGDFDSRRNAVSVLAVDNNYKCTASVFVQNIGGYDGTNPTPGTNDLATVINGMSTGGGIGTSSETWTFTLEDGSTVTKNMVIA